MHLPPVYVGERRRGLLILIGLGLLQAVCVLESAHLMKTGLDEALTGNPDAGSVMVLLGLLFLLAMFGAASRWMERFQSEKLGQTYVHELRLAMFTALARSNPRTRDRRNYSRGDMALRFVTDLNAIRQWISLGQSRLMVSGIVLTFTMSFLAYHSLPVAVGVFFILTLSGGANVFLGSRLESAVVSSRRRRAQLARVVAEKVARIEVVLGFGRLQAERRRIAQRSARLTDAMTTRAYWVGSLRAANEFGVRLSVALVLVSGLHGIASGTSSPGEILALVSLVALMVSPVRDLGRVYEYWKSGKVAAEKIDRVLSSVESDRRNLAIPERQGHLVIDDLRCTSISEPFSSEVTQGERIALVGANGSGKSTLLWCLAGIRRPDSGFVSIDSKPVHRLNRASLRSSIGIAGVDLPLSRGTLGYNLRYRAPWADDASLRAICDQVGLPHRFTLDFLIFEDGSNLSEGERARIMLARALIGCPSLLLLDELDAHLDDEGRERLTDIICGYPGTVVFTTHQRDLLAFSTRIWSVQEGRLSERSTRVNNVLLSKSDEGSGAGR